MGLLVRESQDWQLMTAPRSPRDSKATRERLLRAALDLFTTDGFQGTTTPTLASRAGIAEGTIYRHFASKEIPLQRSIPGEPAVAGRFGTRSGA